MSKPQIRASQVITTFGPGSLVDLPDDAVIVSSLESWKYHRHDLQNVTESRLVYKLEKLLDVKGITLRKPPPAVEEKGFTPDIGAYRFPQWYIVQKPTLNKRGHRSRRLIQWDDLDKGHFIDDDNKRQVVVPIRFVRACEKGHVGDIDWKAFIHGDASDCTREMYLEERGTSGDLDSVWARCACGKDRPMAQAARRELAALGKCNGSRPWLGPGTKESCGINNRLLIRSASNAYFPQLMSVISIPDMQVPLDQVVRELWGFLSAVTTDLELDFALTMPNVQHSLEGYSKDQIWDAIVRVRDGNTSDDRPVKEAEFDALTSSDDEMGADVPDGDFYARSLPRDRWDAPWMIAIERVVLVHRLREVVAQVGFTRFESAGPDIDGELDMGVQRAPLSLDCNWLPAIENRGEGIFLQFKSAVIKSWLKRDEVKLRDSQLQQGFNDWMDEHKTSKRLYPGLPYYMLHSLSHLLITSIALECGYPASSIRERIYTLNGRYGILIYTGSSDAEGTLGGLVEVGRKIQTHMYRALESGGLCSNDPVCAFHQPVKHDHQPLLGSACHGCLLISETCCEQQNDFLDRSLVVQTVEVLGTNFFTLNGK